jgi:hypothetical protein
MSRRLHYSRLQGTKRKLVCSVAAAKTKDKYSTSTELLKQQIN